MGTLTLDRDEIVRLAALATGDEKHEASSYSTLDALLVLYGRVLQVDPSTPPGRERDRFIFSKGHGPAACYAMLAAPASSPTLASPTSPGRAAGWAAIPTALLVPGVEASTGSLGHGLPLAVGVALALRAKGADQRVVVLTGDAELNEGSNWEAIMLAPQLQLENLTLLVIDNRSSTIDLVPIHERWRSSAGRPSSVDGRDHTALEAALSARYDSPAAVVANPVRATS